MSKCIICKKEEDGIICRHCLAKNAGTLGGVVKKGGKWVFVAGPTWLLFIVSKGKIKPKV